MSVNGPLSDVTVLDLTRVLAGPYCTMILADLGARVIKVEPPHGDDARRYGPFVKGKSAYFASLNRGKESIVLDLKKDEDRRIFDRLLGTADVLVENFRPGTMERLGYGWERIHADHPRLIYAACSGFGHTGPDRDRPAYDLVVQAMGGIMSLTGQAGAPPTRVGSSIGDIAAGLFTAIGVGVALYHRAQKGEGMKIDVAMLDCQLAILENAIARYSSTGQVPGPIGSRHPSIAPFECYTTEDSYLAVAVGNDAMFGKLAAAIGRAELAQDPLFATNERRVENVDALKDALEAVLKTEPTRHWLKLFDAEGIPSGPINDIAQAISQPQVLARNMVIETEDPVAGRIKMAGNPVKLSGFPDPPTRAGAPRLDEHREKLTRTLED